MKKLYLLIATFLFFNFSEAQDGSIDTSFDTGTGFNSFISTVTILDDDKIYVGGNFTNFNGTQANFIARLNSDGTLDASFTPASNNNDYFKIIPDGNNKILVGGFFTTYDNTSASMIVRLNNNGSLDSSFNSENGANFSVQDIVVQENNKIVIGGVFTSYNNSTANRIARLNSDGSLDLSFNSGNGFDFNNSSANFDTFLQFIEPQNDGKLIAGGKFSNYNGSSINNLVRLNSDGSLDSSFDIGTGFNDSVFAAATQDDGKIVVAGDFTSFNGTSVNRIVRLNSDGSLDSSFNIQSGFNNSVFNIAIQSDGKVVAGGNFTQFNGAIANYITRLNIDGSIDTTFNIGSGPDSRVNDLGIQSDSKIILVGDFNNYNGSQNNKIARLNVDSTLYLDDTINQKQFYLFPNPAKGQFTIQSNNTSDIYNICIYNNLGQFVLSSKQTVINTSELTSGIYIVEILTLKGKVMKKLLIE
ncbi:T9SS type A sorting domain-containing protein [Winogradskyella sp.]|uniref:T9SS type A sorting domain-containing protein n=1 Tax=Winogradskyella sp. TaxID=1883156 RepID=UPI00260B68AD|nr:T9SS type A sorting domain-containing protein [Winogradskyella sp.]